MSIGVDTPEVTRQKVEEAADWRAKHTNKYGAATVKAFKDMSQLFAK